MTNTPYNNCQYLKYNSSCTEYFDGICHWCSDKTIPRSSSACDSNADTIAAFIFFSPLILAFTILIFIAIGFVCFTIHEKLHHGGYIKIV